MAQKRDTGGTLPLPPSPTPVSHLPTCLLAWAQDCGILATLWGVLPQTHLTGLAQMSNGLREGLSSDCSEGWWSNHAWPLWVAGVTVTLRPPASSREGREGGRAPPPPSPPRACPSSSVSISLKSVPHLLCEKCWA